MTLIEAVARRMEQELWAGTAPAGAGIDYFVKGATRCDTVHRGHRYVFVRPVVAAEAIGAILVVTTEDGLVWECGPRPGDVRLVRPDERAEPTVLTPH